MNMAAQRRGETYERHTRGQGVRGTEDHPRGLRPAPHHGRFAAARGHGSEAIRRAGGLGHSEVERGDAESAQHAGGRRLLRDGGPRGRRAASLAGHQRGRALLSDPQAREAGRSAEGPIPARVPRPRAPGP